MIATGWETYAHDADVGVRGRGSTLAAAFEQAALALTSIVADPAIVRPIDSVQISCNGPDLDLLLFAWLNAVIYEIVTRRMLFSHYAVRIEGTHLAAEALGEPIDRTRHRPTVEPKGATLTDLAVSRDADGSWIAQCVVDV